MTPLFFLRGSGADLVKKGASPSEGSTVAFRGWENVNGSKKESPAVKIAAEGPASPTTGLSG
jgi:hypothetical protein